MVSGRRPRLSQVRSGIALFLAMFLAAFVVWQAPHPVHPFFDSQAEEDRQDCALGTSADRGLATQPTEIIVAELPRPSETVPPARPPIVRGVALVERDARGPPTLCS